MLYANEKLINWLLNESNITRYQIAKDTNVSQTVLSNIYNGKSDLSNITFGVAATLTAYAEKVEKEARGVVTTDK